MNFPIYTSDYDLSLEETYRYLKFFNKHIVFLGAMKKVFGDDELSVVESMHEYRDDGLIIKLTWKVNVPYLHQRVMNMRELMIFHKTGDLKLIDSAIHQYSSKRLYREYEVTAEDKRIFFDIVLKNRKLPRYSREKYKQCEFPVGLQLSTPDVFFQSIVEHNANIIAFEAYYQKRKNENIDSV